MGAYPPIFPTELTDHGIAFGRPNFDSNRAPPLWPFICFGACDLHDLSSNASESPIELEPVQLDTRVNLYVTRAHHPDI